MERLTKAELRALLESIKECYSICDRQSFKQRVLSRLSKIVSTASISHNGIHRGGTPGMYVRLTRVAFTTRLKGSLGSDHNYRVSIHQ